MEDSKFKKRADERKDGKEDEPAKAPTEDQGLPQQPLSLTFAVEFATHLDAQEFMFHAPTIAGLGIKVEKNDFE